MPDQQTTVVTRNISLYPDQDELLAQVARDYGLASISAAVRFIIHDWQRLRKAGGQPVLAPSESSTR